MSKTCNLTIILNFVLSLFLAKVHGSSGSGILVNAGHIPFQVSVLHPDNYFCGGVLYNEFTVITAAHCVHETSGHLRSVSGIRVYAGGTEIRSGDVRTVSAYKIAPNYVNNPGGINDIVLLHLSSPFKLNAKIQPVRIAPKGFYLSAGTCRLSGFGDTPGVAGATSLKEVVVSIRNPSICYTKFPKTFDTSSMICASGACAGDSGGPLICKEVLYGIVSMGPVQCGDDNYVPSTFTSIAVFHDWIVNTANSFGNGLSDNYIIDPHPINSFKHVVYNSPFRTGNGFSSSSSFSSSSGSGSSWSSSRSWSSGGGSWSSSSSSSSSFG